MYLHYMDVHSPYEPPAGFRKWGNADSDLYDGEIAYWSSEFGKLWSALADKGLLSNTVVIFTADHGEQFWEHGSDKHGRNLHSEEIHVPLAVWLPGGEGRRVGELASQIDIAPTVLDLAKARPLEYGQGRSLAGVLRGGRIDERPVISELYNRYFPGQYIAAITTPKYRLIVSDYHDTGSITYRLYDLQADPAEQDNITDRNLSTAETMSKDAIAVVEAQKTLHAKLVPEAPVVKLSPERLAQLKSLGYVGKAGD